MLVVVEKSKVKKALEHVRYTVNKKSTLPVLSNVLIEVKGDLLTFTTTTMEAFVTSRVQLDTRQTDGAVTVNHAKMLKILQTISGDVLVLSVVESDLQIISGASEFTLKGISADEFPVLYRSKGHAVLTIDIPEFLGKLSKVLPFAAKDDTRPILNGVLFSHKLVAADGYQLAIVPLIDRLPKYGVVPRKSVEVVMKVLKKIDGTVSVAIEPDHEGSWSGHAFFATPDVLIGSTLIEGEFPDYQQIVPETDFHVRVGVKDLETLAKQANVFSAIDSHACRGIRLQAGERFTMWAKSPDEGEFEGSIERLEEIGMTSDEVKAVNSNYLLSLLRSPAFAKSKEIQIAWQHDKRSPFVFTDPDDDSGAQYIVMPMHIGVVNRRQQVDEGKAT